MLYSRPAIVALVLLAVTLRLSAQDTWTAGPDMSLTRQRHSATLLADGRLLVAGGAYDFWGEVATRTCEIYDPTTEEWTRADSMSAARSSHTATLLPNGKVLVTGGFNGGGYALSSAELYDPVADRWTALSSMQYRRYRHQAIVLDSDAIMVVGGRQGNIDGHDAMRIWAPVSTCEIYHISTDTWSPAAPMNETRVECGLARLPDGRVLAAGGINDTLVISNWAQPASRTCEIYDPVTDAWTLTDSLQSPRNFVRLVTLDDNTVLSVGGERNQDALYDSQLFDVYSATWLPADSLVSPRIVAEVLKLPNGDVMTIGGWKYLWSSQTSTAERYSVSDSAWSSLASLSLERGWHTATLLGNGDILVAGGTTADGTPLRSTEIYRMNSGAFAIAAVSDAPSDEGGFVRLVWNRHESDRRGLTDAVSGYSVYLRDDIDGDQLPGVETGRWRMVGSVDARAADRYSLTVPALATSTRADHRPSEYLVAALRGGARIANTGVARGLAFDNRGPAQVRSLRASAGASSVSLEWAGSSSADVDHYEVFSGTSPGFATDEHSRIGTTSTASFAANRSERYIRVRAIDRASNPGPATPSVRVEGTNAAPSGREIFTFSLGTVYPLPARASATVPVTLPTEGTISVALFDPLSRLVTRLDGIELAAGVNALHLELGALPTGTYVCTVQSGVQQKSVRIAVVR